MILSPISFSLNRNSSPNKNGVEGAKLCTATNQKKQKKLHKTKKITNLNERSHRKLVLDIMSVNHQSEKLKLIRARLTTYIKLEKSSVVSIAFLVLSLSKYNC